MKTGMKKLLVCVLALALAFTALAAGHEDASGRVAAAGLTPDVAANTDGMARCDYVIINSSTASITWSDAENTYTVTDTGDALSQLYVDLLGLCEWESCCFTIGGKARFGFNPVVKARKTCAAYGDYVALVESTLGVSASKTDDIVVRYVLNTNTKKFHYPDCDSVNQMKEKNRLDFGGTREEAISMGYVPCKNCNP